MTFLTISYINILGVTSIIIKSSTKLNMTLFTNFVTKINCVTNTRGSPNLPIQYYHISSKFQIKINEHLIFLNGTFQVIISL